MLSQALLPVSCTRIPLVAGGRNGVLTPPKTHAWSSPLSKQVPPRVEKLFVNIALLENKDQVSYKR